MDSQNLLLLITVLLNLSLGFFIYSRNRKDVINQSFGIFTFFIALWPFALMMFRYTSNLITALWWMKIAYIAAAFIANSFIYFTLIFPKREKLSLEKKLLILIPALILLLLLLIPNFLTKEVVVYSWGKEVILGVWEYILYAIYFIGFFYLAVYILWQKHKTSVGIIKTQLLYILLGTFIASIFGVIFNLFLPSPWLKNFKLIWLGPSCSVIMVGFISYAIVRYRLMDIRLVLGRGAVYVFSFVTVIASAFLLMFLNNQLATPLPLNISGPLIIVISILLFQPIFRFFEKIAAKYFYYAYYSYQTVLTDLGRRLTQFLELDRLTSLITSTLMDTLKLEKTVILLRDPETGDYRIQKNIGFKEENGISLVKDNFLTQWLEKTQTPLVYEELALVIRDTPIKEEKEKLENLKANMKRIEAALCLPLLIENKIIGMIVLGNKVSGDPYSGQDLELLTTLSNQASIALQNARLYFQVEDLSQNLQEKVTEQTKELQKAYEELKVLDRAKSEFISMASHQLRTPLTTIKGYISMILEGSYGKAPGSMRKPLANVYHSNERLIKLVNDLLNISRVELGKMELETEKIQIENLIQSAYDEMEMEAEKKGLKMIFQKPKEPLPKIEIDPLKIRQVILNLIDNAIRYTRKGKVEITAQKKDNSILILVKDTGEGLSKEEKKGIFEGFTRGSAGVAYFIEGAGLGLYVAAKFLELHKGKIWVESPGKGRGSTFYVELPVK